LTVVLGGLTVGFFLYRRGVAPGEIDPMRKWLGPVWWLFHRKYYVDELYHATIIPFTIWLASILFKFDDKWVIDPIVNFIGRLGVWVSAVLAAFDHYVVDGVVNGSAYVADFMGGVLRRTQNGQVQVYLLVLAISITIWLLLQALPLILTLV
jgi:NADH-quinone oxidoreductase subunit L